MNASPDSIRRLEELLKQKRSDAYRFRESKSDYIRGQGDAMVDLIMDIEEVFGEGYTEEEERESIQP